VKADLLDSGLLGRVHVGPHRLLQQAYDRAIFVKRTLVWALVVCRLVVAAFTAAVWALWRKASYYGWFSLCSLAWVAAELNLLVVDIPVSTSAWYWLLYVSIGWWAIFAVRLIASFLDISNPAAERRVMVLGFSGSVALALLAVLDSPYFHPVSVGVWLPVAFLTSCTIFRNVIALLRMYPDEIELRVVFIVALSVVGCVLWDLLMQLGIRPRGGLTVPPYSSAVALAGMGWVLLRRFVGALRESQALVATLEGRVREKRAALDESYARIREAERARVLAEERERIMREMHDGLGSHLVTTLALLDGDAPDRAAVGAAVRVALDDLRLMVDALVPLDGDLLGALALLRARLQPRLEAAGVRVQWRVADLPPVPDLGAAKVLEILRILQEAVTNVLRHAGARTLVVRTTATDGSARAVAVEIADDGRGFDATATSGRGLHHMRQRARAIGAVLEIDGAGHGTCVRLRLPLVEEAAA
jgi:signal transduction histidine kinase